MRAVTHGARGVVVSAHPQRTRWPVGFADTVLELDPAGAAPVEALAAASGGPGGGPVVRADQSGRFYRRSAPGEAPRTPPGRGGGPGFQMSRINCLNASTSSNSR